MGYKAVQPLLEPEDLVDLHHPFDSSTGHVCKGQTLCKGQPPCNELVDRFPDTPWDYHIICLHWGGARAVTVGIYGSLMECLGLVSLASSSVHETRRRTPPASSCTCPSSDRRSKLKRQCSCDDRVPKRRQSIKRRLQRLETFSVKEPIENTKRQLMSIVSADGPIKQIRGFGRKSRLPRHFWVTSWMQSSALQFYPEHEHTPPENTTLSPPTEQFQTN